MRRILRILSTALVTAGIVVLVDVAVTLAWEEPVSSIYAAIQQQRAERELEELEDAFLERRFGGLQALTNTRAARKLANALAKELETGKGVGRIRISSVGLDAVIVEGTATTTLQKGPGRYRDTGLPGQGATIAVAGHRTTYLAPFRRIAELDAGDEMIVEMPYGSFTYTIEETRVVEPTDVGIIRDVGHERLVLTSCHPPYSAAQRYAVLGRLARIELAQAER